MTHEDYNRLYILFYKQEHPRHQIYIPLKHSLSRHNKDEQIICFVFCFYSDMIKNSIEKCLLKSIHIPARKSHHTKKILTQKNTMTECDPTFRHRFYRFVPSATSLIFFINC